MYVYIYIIHIFFIYIYIYIHIYIYMENYWEYMSLRISGYLPKFNSIKHSIVLDKINMLWKGNGKSTEAF